MSAALPRPRPPYPAHKRIRRTSTAVLAGAFDPRPARDALTSLLNGVGRYDAVERKAMETSREKKKDRRLRDKERLRAKRAADKVRDPGLRADEPGTSLAAAGASRAPRHSSVASIDHISAPSAFWRATAPGRPSINMASAQRSVSVTPPPMPSSSASTPDPSESSSTSRTSSKRPRTPDDDEDLYSRAGGTSKSPAPQQPRKKRAATRKGWKGWVEGELDPSPRLINLDEVKVLQDRRTRSGKNFDA